MITNIRRMHLLIVNVVLFVNITGTVKNRSASAIGEQTVEKDDI